MFLCCRQNRHRPRDWQSKKGARCDLRPPIARCGKSKLADTGKLSAKTGISVSTRTPGCAACFRIRCDGYLALSAASRCGCGGRDRQVRPECVRDGSRGNRPEPAAGERWARVAGQFARVDPESAERAEAARLPQVASTASSAIKPVRRSRSSGRAPSSRTATSMSPKS